MAALGEDWRRGQCNIMGTGRAGSQKWCPRSDSRGRRNLRGLEPQKLRRLVQLCGVLPRNQGKWGQTRERSASLVTHILDKSKWWEFCCEEKQRNMMAGTRRWEVKGTLFLKVCILEWLHVWADGDELGKEWMQMKPFLQDLSPTSKKMETGIII